MSEDEQKIERSLDKFEGTVRWFVVGACRELARYSRLYRNLANPTVDRGFYWFKFSIVAIWTGVPIIFLALIFHLI